MVSYYYPERTYHQLNAVAYPDHSFVVPGKHEVLRAFWRKGEQMWDEDMNNNFEWIAFWTAPYTFWRNDDPRAVWYSPYLKLFSSEPDHVSDSRTPWKVDTPRALIVDSVFNPPEDDRAYKMWSGSKAIALADRVLFGCWSDGGNIRGLAYAQEYVDEIEIAMFFSETRKNRIIGAHTVAEPFRLRGNSYSSRVRGWPIDSRLEVLKNGALVGYLIKSEFSSRLAMVVDTVFNTGDVLQVKTPGDVGIKRAVTVSIVGELL